MIDNYQSNATGIESPVTNASAVTPHDENDLPFATRGLWVGTAGDVRVIMLSGSEETFPNMHVGWHPIRVTRVKDTGTTAEGIVAVE